MLESKKILLTGLTGRIGSAAAAALAGANDVWGLARFTREGSREEAEELGITAVVGDFARDDLAQLLPDDFDYVVHVAANVMPGNAEEGMTDNADGSARLMSHCRRAKGFLHVSATGIYAQNPDPYHAYRETDDLGGGYGGQYAPTKLAAEGAVRAAALILGLPTTIARQNVQYGGPATDGGLIGIFLDRFLDDGTVLMPESGPFIIGAIHEDDIVAQIEPCLKAASVPATIVNWGGDEVVDWQEMFEYIGTLVGRKPIFVRSGEFAFPNCYPDPTKRRAMSGPCSVSWKEGVRRMIEVRHPELELSARG
jgi:nucleoside-diphosphate-sugar epimerase